jgi:DNA-binding phage protein
MAKIRTSAKQKVSTKNIRNKPLRTLKSNLGVDLYNPTEALLDEERIGRAIWECLKNGDSEGVVEIIQIYIDACNKAQLSKDDQLPKTTLYHCFKSKNPTIKTLAKIVHASC